MWASVEVTPLSPGSWLRPSAQACCLWNGSGFSCCHHRILTLPPSHCHPSPPVLSSTFSFCSFAPWRSWSSAWTPQRNCGTDAPLRRPLLHPQTLYLPRLPWHWPSDEGQTDKREDEHKSKKCIVSCRVHVFVYLCILLLFFQLFQHSFKLSLLLFCLLHGGLVLFFISHGHHSQDQIHQVERSHKDHQYKEDHIRLPSSSQSLREKSWEEMSRNYIFYINSITVLCF